MADANYQIDDRRYAPSLNFLPFASHLAEISVARASVIQESSALTLSPGASMVGAEDELVDQWSTLIPELLELILDRLRCLPDCIRFGAVCRSWRSIQLRNHCHDLLSQYVLLLLPDEEDGPNRELLQITTSHVQSLPLPEAQKKTIFGSSFGWLLIMDYSPDSGYPIQLLNPFTRSHIPLPPATTFANFYDEIHEDYPYEIFVIKGVLSSTPNSPDCVVMAIHGVKQVLGFCRVGDKRWTSLEGCEDPLFQYNDLIYHKGQFYAVTQHNTVVVCDLSSTVPKVIEVAQSPIPDWVANHYLVESLDGLLLVMRYLKYEGANEDYRTFKFAIHRLDTTARKWEKVTTLGDQMLFVGGSGSISVSGEMHGGNSNCIYFVDDNIDGYRLSGLGCYDMGIYNLADNSITPFDFSSYRFWPSPMFWITPP